MNRDSITSTHFKPTLASARAQAAATLLAQNNYLSGTGDYRTNEKTVNGIYLSTVAVGNYSLSAAEVSTLQAIALQCPITGGEAVMRARDLLTLSPYAPVFYNDAAICGSGLKPATERSDADTDGDFVEIRPNPASEYLEIQYDFSTEKSGRQLILFDVYGKIAATTAIHEAKGSQTISVRNLPSGIYRFIISDSTISGNVIVTH